MKRSDWISITAFILSIIACTITWLRVEVYTTNDTFVGIMAGFMGACATIIVGAQIYNSIEYKNKLEIVSSLQEQLRNEIKLMQNERIASEHRMKYGVNIAAGLSTIDRNPLLAYGTFFKAMIESLEINESKYIKVSLTNLRGTVCNLKLMIENQQKFSRSKIKTIGKDTSPQLLSEYKLYPLIESEYNTIYQDFISEIKKIYANPQ